MYPADLTINLSFNRVSRNTIIIFMFKRTSLTCASTVVFTLASVTGANMKIYRIFFSFMRKVNAAFVTRNRDYELKQLWTKK